MTEFENFRSGKTVKGFSALRWTETGRAATSDLAALWHDELRAATEWKRFNRIIQNHRLAGLFFLVSKHFSSPIRKKRTFPRTFSARAELGVIPACAPELPLRWRKGKERKLCSGRGRTRRRASKYDLVETQEVESCTAELPSFFPLHVRRMCRRHTASRRRRH